MRLTGGWLIIGSHGNVALDFADMAPKPGGLTGGHHSPSGFWKGPWSAMTSQSLAGT